MNSFAHHNPADRDTALPAREASNIAGLQPGSQVADLEIALLLEAIYRLSGFDFRNYALSSLRRRILEQVAEEELRSVSALQDRILHEPDSLDRFVLNLAVSVSSMFRDPGFYLAFRRDVVPVLAGLPYIRIWSAGCACGEEAYSLAILLEEEGLYDRCRIYATDMNENSLREARAGVLPLALMKEYTSNYLASGGHTSFSAYYSARYDRAILRSALRRNIVFSRHNLATDACFQQFHLVLCRNVLIYFNAVLRERALNLLHDSLLEDGILCLGQDEPLSLAAQNLYAAVVEEANIFRRLRAATAAT